MQNKANFQKVKFNVTKVLTRNYDQLDTWSIRKTKPIQSQLKPIQSQLKPIKANSKPIKANIMPKQSQFKPKQTQFQSQNYTGWHNRCHKSTAMFTKNNLNGNYFLVNPLYQVRKSRLIQRVDFMQHGLLTHIRVAFRIVETKLKVYTYYRPDLLFSGVSNKDRNKAFFRTFRYELCSNTIVINKL